MTSLSVFHKTRYGQIIHGDSLELLRRMRKKSVDLIVTSPPFGLLRQKDYGNVAADQYVDWFDPFASTFRHVLKDSGSLVIDIGGSWQRGRPTRNLYHYKLLIRLCESHGFYLAQEIFWWNPAKLPGPAEWVNVRRVRVKDAVDCVWWLSPTPWPKASNTRVLMPYREAMQHLLRNGYQAKKRPSGHDISSKFAIDNRAAIPPNLIAIPHTASNDRYLRYCAANRIKPHPARFPVELPEFFIRMLTDKGDLVIDPFAGSCATGEAAERLQRRWKCVDLEKPYLAGALGRFSLTRAVQTELAGFDVFENKANGREYSLWHPGQLWNGVPKDRLPRDGGRSRGKNRARK